MTLSRFSAVPGVERCFDRGLGRHEIVSKKGLVNEDAEQVHVEGAQAVLRLLNAGPQLVGEGGGPSDLLYVHRASPPKK